MIEHDRWNIEITKGFAPSAGPLLAPPVEFL
jgi:hypothetical protein